ncbi:MAG: HAMP domain-containing sensor histidine kinase [Myxococcota bacterium]
MRGTGGAPGRGGSISPGAQGSAFRTEESRVTVPLRRIRDAIDALGRSPGATDDEHLPVRFLVWMGVLMSTGGLFWGVLSAACGLWASSTVPFGYVVLTALNLGVLARTRRFGRARFVQVALSLLLPFLFQWSVGGFVASGAVALWGLLSLVGSMTFANARETLFALAGFVALTVLSGLIDADVASLAGVAAQTPRSTLFFVVNLSLITSFVFGLVVHLDVRRRTDNAALRDANGTIIGLNHALSEHALRAEEAEREARDANRAKSVFLANMSHELRTPLNAIIGYSDMIVEDLADEVAGRDAARIHQAGTHLLSLINDILDLAKIEAGRMQVLRDVVSVRQLVDATVATIVPMLEANGDRIEVSAPPGLAIVGDERKLRQVLLNLLSNAAKFTENGLVQLRVAHRDEELLIEVSDTGIGMSDEQLSRAMLPFQQADASTTRRYGGTGLGLTLVQQFVEMLGGTVTLRSQPGEGLTATVVVPAPAASSTSLPVVASA